MINIIMLYSQQGRHHTNTAGQAEPPQYLRDYDIHHSMDYMDHYIQHSMDYMDHCIHHSMAYMDHYIHHSMDMDHYIHHSMDQDMDQ